MGRFHRAMQLSNGHRPVSRFIPDDDLPEMQRLVYVCRCGHQLPDSENWEVAHRAHVVDVATEDMTDRVAPLVYEPCETTRNSSCADTGSGKSPDAKDGADRYCFPCRLRHALDEGPSR